MLASVDHGGAVMGLRLPDPAVELDHVSFLYDVGESGTGGVDDVSMVIPRGQVVLICGDSGCGKTTVTRLINGLAPHYFEGNLTGTVRVCGLSVADSPLTELSRHVGSVFQNPDSQFLALDVEGELAFGCENYEMDPSEIRRRISAAERDFRLVGLRGRSVRSLSGGQKQTLACAGVACVDPEIMVLDEPSSNLDARAIERLRGIIAMWRARGKTVVIAEHRLYWLNGLVDRVAHMTMGRVDYEMDGEEFFSMEDGRRREWGLRPLTVEQIVSDAGVQGSRGRAAHTGPHPTPVAGFRTSNANCSRSRRLMR